eukprot:SAG31_NODE_31425_length_368_cov_0.947955_1_plen_87_part_01
MTYTRRRNRLFIQLVKLNLKSTGYPVPLGDSLETAHLHTPPRPRPKNFGSRPGQREEAASDVPIINHRSNKKFLLTGPLPRGAGPVL